MGDVQRTSCSLPLIDLTNDSASRINHTAPYIYFTGSDDRGTNHSPEIIDLTDDDNQHFTSNIPVIDLTGDDDQFLNYRIPVVDLTNDDIQEITQQTQCIDLIDNDASSNNHTIRNFNLGGIDGGDTKRSTKLIDLTADDIQDFNPNTPVVDLTCDMTNDDVQDITHRLQSFDLSDGKQQNINDCIPTINLTNNSYQNIDQIISATDLTSDKDCNNEIPVIDMIQNNDRVIRKRVDDVEMNDLSCNNLSTSFQKRVIENNLRIPAANLSYNMTENDFLKCNEASNMNVMHIGTFSTMQKFNRSKDILANHPLKNNFEGRKETILASNPLTNNSAEKYFSPKKSEKISQNNTSDFLKRAHHPIPLRHSLGRSTLNTSQNILIECIESSEDQSRTLTVSSIIRRKKSKSITDLPKSKKVSTSKENLISFETFMGFFQKFCIFLLLTFIGLYYWI